MLTMALLCACCLRFKGVSDGVKKYGVLHSNWPGLFSGNFVYEAPVGYMEGS